MDWRSTKQTLVAISTVGAEHVAMYKACVIILHFRNLLESIHEKPKQATVVFEDNSGAVQLSRSASISPRTEHIDVKLHNVRSLIAEGVVNVTYIRTELQRADILISILGVVKFLNNCLLLQAVWAPPLFGISLKV